LLAHLSRVIWLRPRTLRGIRHHGGEPNDQQHKKENTKMKYVLMLAALLAFTATSADAQNRQGGTRTCSFQACFDRCVASGGPPGFGSPLSQRHCGNWCAHYCPQK
jgi:hypothetical protein